MNRYARNIAPARTPQTEPLMGQIGNNGGGYSWEVDCWTRLDRFLILGCEGGSYYAGERKLTSDAARSLTECAATDPQRTVDRIVQISIEGRAAKNDPAIFCLALLACDPVTSGLALPRLNEVCRIGTHLFQFVDAVTQFRGWGRALKRAVANWYLDRRLDNLSTQVVKYKQRGGWSHKDVLSLCHAKTTDDSRNQILRYAVHGGTDYSTIHLAGEMAIRAAKDASEAASSVSSWGLVREQIPTQFLNDPRVWEALIDLHMPMTALIRNLGKMTNVGALKPNTVAAGQVCEDLRNKEALKRQRIHPFSVLLALTTYRAGKGVRGKLAWNPVTQIVDALEDAYDASFGQVEPTGKRYLVGVDVSASMTWVKINNTHLTPRDAAGCMAATLVRSEDQVQCYAFSSGLSELPITKRMSLAEVQFMTQSQNPDYTDCALPMIYAMQQQIPVDVFCVYTDNETNSRSIHPAEAIRQYRKAMGIDAKLVVVGFSADKFSIADPNDAGMLDVVGFDANAPKVIADFARG